jgi:hypothetical protein
MNKKALLPLALISAAAVFSGCAHQNTRTGSRTNILGGLVEIEKGAYQPAPHTSIDGNSNELVGNAGKPSGTQVKVLWGTFTNNDY